MGYPFGTVWNRLLLTLSCEPAGPVTMAGGAVQSEVQDLTLQDITSGQYVLLCGHPEAFAHKTGQTTLRALSRQGFIKAILVDEVHLGTEGHWSSIRPNMLRKIFSVKVHAVPKAPIGCFTATITDSELRTVQVVAGRKKPMTILAQGPIQRNFKVCLVQRPPSQVPFIGCTNAQGVFKPGLLHLIRLLVLDEFLAKFKAGDLASFPTTMIFFRDSVAMSKCNSYLIEKTSEKTSDLVNSAASSNPFLDSSDLHKHIQLQSLPTLLQAVSLTFQKMNQARLLRASCVRAIDRLDFMGIFRVQLFHLEMAKCAGDILAALPDINKNDDRGFLGHLLTLVGVDGRFSNLKKKIVNNYEWHAQFHKEYQSGLVSQMFDTYIKQKGIDVTSVKSRTEVENLLESMLLHFGCNWYWDPSFEDPMADIQCDLFKVSRDQVIRLLHSLAFSQCEHQNDFLGLRALRRTAIVMFRSKSSRSKYALYLSPWVNKKHNW